jgi:hypothetical protein
MRAGSVGRAIGCVGAAGAACLALLLPSGASAQLPPLSSLKKGDEIDLRNCTYGPGETHAGRDSGQYLVDRNAFYAIVFVPTDVPGGHFRFRGVYPRARWFSFESYNQALASQGVIGDSEIDPDAGSVNPFLPGKTYHAGSHYTVDVRMVPPADRADPPPHNVLYAGYRMNPTYGQLDHATSDGLLYRVYAAPGTPQGDVPLPRLSWVVDDPATNPFQTDVEVCAAMQSTSVQNGTILKLNDILDKRFTSPTLVPFERNVDVMTDEVPRNPPYVNVIRPASNGYQGAYFNSKTPYIYIRPDPQFGRFLTVRFKAPTFTRIEDGRPATGNEQTRYWSWCDSQFVSPVNITQGCLMDKQFHIDPHGYATLVFSDPSERPVVDGKPWPDWLPWPGGGADMPMRMIDPNPRTFPQSPYFMPLLNENDALDYLRGVLFEDQITTWMGEYFPTVRYCTKAKFEANDCF